MGSDSASDVENAAGIVARPYEKLLPALTTPLPDTALFDQLLLFPMKLGLSVALASTAINRQSNEMAKRLEPVALTR